MLVQRLGLGKDHVKIIFLFVNQAIMIKVAGVSWSKVRVQSSLVMPWGKLS